MPNQRWIVVLATILVAGFLVLQGVRALRSVPTSQRLAISDSRVKPYLVSPPAGRANVGLAPIPKTGSVVIREQYGYVQLEFDSPTFIKSVYMDRGERGFKWFAEEDTYIGPLTYEESFDREHESVYIAYSLRNSESGPSKGRYVSYSGPRKRYLTTNSDGLPLVDVLPLLDEWRAADSSRTLPSD